MTSEKTKDELKGLGFAFDTYWDRGRKAKGVLLAQYGNTDDPKLFGQGARYAGRDKCWRNQPAVAGRTPFVSEEDAIAFANEAVEQETTTGS